MDAYMQTTSGEALVNIKACNEWDAKQANTPEWRAKLDKQRGAVLATEIRNNGFKMAKWTMGALLAGADFIKFGYVSRTNPKDSTQHIILGVQQFQPCVLPISLSGSFQFHQCRLQNTQCKELGKLHP